MENPQISIKQLIEFSVYMNGKRITERRFKSLRSAKKWVNDHMIIIQKEETEEKTYIFGKEKNNG